MHTTYYRPLDQYPWWLKPIVFLERHTKLKVLTDYLARYQRNASLRYQPSIGEVIDIQFLEPRNMTDGDLADALGLDEELVLDICMGRTHIDREIAEKLAKTFTTTAEYFLDIQARHNAYRRQEFNNDALDF